jgi:LPS export ABC transporter protein LptC
MNFKNISPGKLKLPLISILVIILVLVVALVFFKTSVLITPTIKNINIDSSADIFLNNFLHSSKTNGIKDFAIKAASAKIINAQNLAILKDVSITIFTEENTEVEITAPNGRFDTKTHDLELFNKVTIKFEDSSLKTDKLHYSKKSNIIYSDGQVEITKGTSVLQADSLVANLKNSTIKLEGNIKGKFFETDYKL